ncbi:MAG: AAA family ATPase, partial [Bacteroidaceae bacterium]|nr:AAA family ATPase [Bacteroidaceae bacterium]
MEIKLPAKKGETADKTISGVINMVIVGANGAGKSRFGKEIEQRYYDNTFRISALKTVMPIDETAEVKANSITGEYNKYFKENKQLSLKTEFEQLFALLIREEMQNLIDYKNEISQGREAKLKPSTLDKTQVMWEKIFPHHKIIRSNGKLEIVSDTSPNNYNAMQMSHGEKVVLYLIAASLIARPNSIIIVDEPEMHLHPSMTSSLWNDIESQRPDCCFIYLTHDLNFAVSRSGKRIWVNSYDAETNSFDYEFIENSDSLPEDIYLELLGGRKPVLFVEGDTTSSIDNRLYPLVFTEYTVK